jgi:hypothetical protein
MMTWLIRRRPVTSPEGRCDICGGTGILELRVLPNGKEICPVCLHAAEVRAAARQDRCGISDVESRPRKETTT